VVEQVPDREKMRRQLARPKERGDTPHEAPEQGVAKRGEEGIGKALLLRGAANALNAHFTDHLNRELQKQLEQKFHALPSSTGQPCRLNLPAWLAAHCERGSRCHPQRRRTSSHLRENAGGTPSHCRRIVKATSGQGHEIAFPTPASQAHPGLVGVPGTRRVG
jgi:hypothetical protein